jgi:hypothetical protein
MKSLNIYSKLKPTSRTVIFHFQPWFLNNFYETDDHMEELILNFLLYGILHIHHLFY